eukprot:3266016-Rhodomonas_salina.3
MGPSPETKVIGVVLDTWGKWTAVAVLTFLNTIFTEFVYDCLQPWLTTTVVDHKTDYIPYTKPTMIYISIVCSSYRTIIQVVIFYTMLSQVDFVIVRFVADIMMTYTTTKYFLKNKTHDAQKFHRFPTIVEEVPFCDGRQSQDTDDTSQASLETL